MTLIYYGECKDINDNSLRVEFLTNSTTSASPVEVILTDDPISIEYMQDSILSPFKKSGASINILVPNVLYDLFSNEWLGIQVRILKNNQLFWLGYVSPNIYSQSYNDELEILTVECIDTISMLCEKKIKYDDLSSAITFYDVFQKIFDEINPNKELNNIYVHQLFQTLDNKDIFKQYGVMIRNFFDEIEEPTTLQDVAEGILNYLNLTLFQWQDGYYLIALPELAKYNNAIQYNRTTHAELQTALYTTIKQLSEIGVHQTNAHIMMGDVYNTLNVIASLNPNEAPIPSPLDEDGDLINQNVNQEKYYTTLTGDTDSDTAYNLVYSFWKSKGDWNYTKPLGYMGNTIDEVTDANVNDVFTGTFWSKTANYQVTPDSLPSTLEFNTNITTINTVTLNVGYDLMFGLNKNIFNIFQGGAFIVDMDYFFSTNKLPFEEVKDEQAKKDKYKEDRIIKFPMRLSVGNKYYWNHGVTTEWRDYADYYYKSSNGYFQNLIKAGVSSKWYKIYNPTKGFYEFCTEAQYIASTQQKTSGDTKSISNYYFTDSAGNTITVNEEYATECIYGDRGCLISNVKKDDNIFYETRSLANGVGWMQKLEPPETGNLIPLPNDTALLGKIKIDVYAPFELGDKIDGSWGGATAIHVTNFNMYYSTPRGKLFVENEADDNDLKYTNVINDDYAKEGDDIIMTVNTYSSAQTSFSYVLDVENGVFAGEVINNDTKEIAIPEQHLLNRYVTHYQSPKIEYSNTLKNKNITPFTFMSESNLDKIMIAKSLSYKMGDDAVEITLQEF